MIIFRRGKIKVRLQLQSDAKSKRSATQHWIVLSLPCLASSPSSIRPTDSPTHLPSRPVPHTATQPSPISWSFVGFWFGVVSSIRLVNRRRRNCENARKARARKKLEVNQLQDQVAKLKQLHAKGRVEARKAKELSTRTVR